MRKAINLKVKLTVVGDDEPAHDFTQTATKALKEIIAAGRLRHPMLKVTVKEIAEDTDDDDAAAGPPK